ncbi:MAG: M18 family aminopeptidase [Eubacteriales bacterium]
MNSVHELIDFIGKSPTAYHAIDHLSERLHEAGYRRICESEEYKLTPGGKYFVTRGQSSLIAFRIPTCRPLSFRIAASHSDSPMFKLKSRGVMVSQNRYTKLNIERYGGMILSSWFDRPLSVAGRVVVRDGDRLISKTVDLGRDLAIIPNVCIHFNRQINDGYKYNPQVDLLPIIGDQASGDLLNRTVADAAEVSADSIVSSDLFLYNRTPGTILGLRNEFFAAPRIDNLECAYGTLEGFLPSVSPDGVIPVYAVFDNEETGSASRQGAASTFLYDTLTRISASLSLSDADYLKMLASSFMVSADNAHAKHPNHPELSDADNAPYMNCGVVIKYNANQRYTTDALSDAIFSEICRKAGVPVQRFANRSDMAGGSTLGNISNTKVAVPTVDIGLAQLAMHSAYETAGCADLLSLIDASKAFYETDINQGIDGEFTVKCDRIEEEMNHVDL